ncbi:MAG: GSCFA domain-containing protein [Spirochaetales bacterium]|nr:GSCFA domain-containing protein [Spirochaetales bacterium]
MDRHLDIGGLMNPVTREFLKKSITPVAVAKPPFAIKPEQGIFFIGSCFSEYLSDYLVKHALRCCTSPFGNIYNPLSIASGLEMLCRRHVIGDDEIFEHHGLFRHFAFHTKVCMPDKQLFLETINGRLEEARAFLENAGVIVLTLGTAYTYINRETGRVVNNCHKLSPALFERKRLDTTEITSRLGEALKTLKKAHPHLIVILTLSPVRHLRDRAEENSLSKAVLRCSIGKLAEFPDSWYFPSYEILLDELRDYRYYADDLCHPSSSAADYIMSRFCESCFSEEARAFMEEMEKIKKAFNHRPLHGETDEYRLFMEKQISRLAGLQKRYPMLPVAQTVEKRKESGA